MRPSLGFLLAVVGIALFAHAMAAAQMIEDLQISPAYRIIAAGEVLKLEAHGGSGKGYAWSFATNESGGTIDAQTGRYVAGPALWAIDWVRVIDSRGQTKIVSFDVRGTLRIDPIATPVPPGDRRALTTNRGRLDGVNWRITENRSGGSMRSTDVYVAGPNGDVEDVLEATIGSWGTATTRIKVGPPLRTSSPIMSVTPRGQLRMVATGGSGNGYRWSIVRNGSGAKAMSATRLYVAGPKSGTWDMLEVTDALGSKAACIVNVGVAAP
jgi:hypothetical protein